MDHCPDHHLSQARALVRAGRFDKAVPILQQAAEAFPHNTAVSTALANLWSDYAQPQQAIDWAVRAFRDAPESLHSALALTNAVYCKAVHGEKVADYLPVIKKLAALHDSSALLAKLSDLFWLIGEYERACGAAWQAVTLGPGDAGAQCAAVRAAYAEGSYDQAYDHLLAALELDPPAVWLDILDSFSAEISDIVRQSGREAQLAQWLDRQLAQHDGLNCVFPGPYAPWKVEDVMRQRQELIAKGLPSCALVTMVKSGTVSVSQIIQAGFQLSGAAYALINLRVIPSWARDFARGGAMYTTHLWATKYNIDALKEAGIRQVIVHVRDPRQAVLSLAHHYDRYRSYHPNLRIKRYFEYDVAGKIDLILDVDWPEYISWLKGWISAANEVTVHFLTFEEFVTDPEAYVEKIVTAYGGDGHQFDRTAALERVAEKDYHFRKGHLNEWRNVFTPKQIDLVNDTLPRDFIRLFNWSH